MIKRFLLPIGIVIGGFFLAALIVATGPEITPQAPPSTAPLVRTWPAASQTVQMTTVTHGTVLPRTQSELIPEVSGRVIGMSPSMVSGGFFKKDDVLIEIDPLDYELALEQARAGLASARSELTNAKRGYERLQDLAKRQSASQSQYDDALNRLRFAEASLREASAQLSKAERDLERTRITAPYDGRVRSEQVDIGQFVNRGNPVASLYATDAAEVRLPIHDDELAYLHLPLGSELKDQRPAVILRAQFGGEEHIWEGEVVRTEGELDPQTRMINIIAQVDSPYKPSAERPPLAVGLFVEAEIIGTRVNDIYVVPRSALQANNQIYIINGENRLEFRDVDVLRIVDEDVYISNGFRTGEIVCLSTINNAIEGMQVRPVDEQSLASS